LIKSSDVPKINIEEFDKVVHAFFHFVFVTLWFLFFNKKLNSVNSFQPLAISFVFSLVFGIIIEILQYYTTTRSADIFDVLANTIGALLATLFIILANDSKGLKDKI
jgi:VanZ family protein